MTPRIRPRVPPRPGASPSVKALWRVRRYRGPPGGLTSETRKTGWLPGLPET
jgi:hypothetical protein